MGVYTSISGLLRVELTSADIAASLRSINEKGVSITDVQVKDDLTASFIVSRVDLPTINKLAGRKGEKLKILEWQGLFWTIRALIYRPILLFGFILFLFLSLYLPSRVLFVSVSGNVDVPTKLIVAAAQEAGIRFGASRREIRSERVKNTLLEAVPQLQWVGVNSYGCIAEITVNERAQFPGMDDNAGISHIVAVSDGVITSCTVTSGSALCCPGQAVQKGQILISGYTDLSRITTAARAQGEVFAETRRELTAVTPSDSLVRGEKGDTQTNFSVLLGKKRINFYKGSGISDGRCVKMIKEYTLTLPGGYLLPVTLIKETVIDADCFAQQCDKAEAEGMLSAFAKGYLNSQTVSLTVLSAQEEFAADSGYYRLIGAYACTEMIGREQSEQIGDFHGKTD